MKDFSCFLSFARYVFAMNQSIESAPVAPSNLRDFILAGNATFTVRSEKTGNRFTFKVRQPNNSVPHFVSVLSGTDNENDFTFLGAIFNEKFYQPSAKKVSLSSPSAIAAKWVVSRVIAGQSLAGCEVWHEGKCGRCGRKLTVPESIETGIGPECLRRMESAA